MLIEGTEMWRHSLLILDQTWGTGSSYRRFSKQRGQMQAKGCVTGIDLHVVRVEMCVCACACVLFNVIVTCWDETVSVTSKWMNESINQSMCSIERSTVTGNKIAMYVCAQHWGAFAWPLPPLKSSTTYSECVSVALVIQQAMRMRRIVICGLSGSALFFHIIS